MQFDSYVAHCNSSEYIIMIVSVTAATGEKFTSLKLYSKYSVKKKQKPNKLEHVS